MADEERDAQAVSSEARTRFREAVDRKKNSAHTTAEGRQNTGVVHGAEVTGAARRTFRRKTG